MKFSVKLISCVIAVLLLISCFGIIAYADSSVSVGVQVNGEEIDRFNIESDIEEFEISFSMTVPEKLDDGQFELYSDNSALELTEWSFPVIDNSVIDRINESDNTGRFNFSSIRRPYDFTEGGVMVSAKFKLTAKPSTTWVNFKILELDSAKTVFFANANPSEAGAGVLDTISASVKTDFSVDETILEAPLNIITYANVNKLDSMLIESDKVAVSFLLTAPEKLVDGQFTLRYDSRILELSDVSCPVIDASSIINIVPEDNCAYINFSSPRLYDFTAPQIFVTAYFNVLNKLGGDTNVELLIQVLESEKTEYVNNFAVTNEGREVISGITSSIIPINPEESTVPEPTESTEIPETTAEITETQEPSEPETIPYYPHPAEPTEITQPTEEPTIATEAPTEPATAYTKATTPSANINKNKSAFKTKTIKVNTSSKTLYVKQSFTIKASASDGAELKYSSSNTKAVSVNSKGKVTAKKKGSATITVSSATAYNIVKIKVINPTLNKTKKTLKVGDSFKLKIKGKIGAAKFSSDNKKVAAVSKSGKITAKKKGKAVITVKTNGLKLKCAIKVKK